MDIIVSIFYFALGLFIYFMPTVVGYANKKQNAGAILLVNLLLGWTLIGWVIALTWSVCKDPQTTVIIKEVQKET